MAEENTVVDTITKKGALPSRNIGLQSMNSMKYFWRTYIAVDFEAEESKLVDHLANERTWHNWLATSNAIAWMGVVVAQMSKIDRVVRPGHANMLRKKACLCQGLAIAILVVGTYRFLQEQSAVNGTGKRASQWSLLAAGFLILGLLCSFFAIVIVAEVDR